jgi:hypothetical protein
MAVRIKDLRMGSYKMSGGDTQSPEWGRDRNLKLDGPLIDPNWRTKFCGNDRVIEISSILSG